MARTFAAWSPFGPFVTSNSTFWPSARVRNPSAWIAVWWQKTSSPPLSCVMKPKPFASLNHFTEPVAIYGIDSFLLCSGAAESAALPRPEWDRGAVYLHGAAPGVQREARNSRAPERPGVASRPDRVATAPFTLR